VTSPYSILRTHEYEVLRSLTLTGRVLDVGGGLATEYGQRMPSNLRSVNMDVATRPSVVADLNRSLPFSTGVFDTIMSLNTLEHLVNDEIALRESLRVLRGGGEFHLFIPFICAVHGSPFDWHRHTADWWREKTVEAGADASTVKVVPLGWCRLTSALSLLDRGKMKILRAAVMAIGLCHSQLGRLVGKPLRFSGYLDTAAVPLAYYVTGCKVEQS
jgi:SAM-dependent methyltransferase